MAHEVTGKLYKLFDTQAVTEHFNKREFVLELPGRHPQLVMFQLTGKRCADLDGFSLGEGVRVEFSLRGREWRSKLGEVRYFNSLEVSKLERAGDAPAGGPPPRESGPPQEEAPDDSEVPF
jgi:hypothetical protein